MPIYEYRCKSCGQHVEIIQKVGGRPRRKCEQCGGRLEKLISRTAFLLKGGGWYSEGYGSAGGAKRDKAEKGETKSEKKKDAASAGASESKSGGESNSGGDSKNGGGKRSASSG